MLSKQQGDGIVKTWAIGGDIGREAGLQCSSLSCTDLGLHIHILCTPFSHLVPRAVSTSL
jgi:hypothetical protein